MQLIENVQRRATKFILHYSNIDYKERLVKLDLLPLSLRREICDVNLFQRCINGHYDMLLDNFVVFNTPVQDRPIARSSSDHLKLIPQRCRTESHQLSFFHRIVPIWNQLPFHIRSALSFSSFKTQVHQFYQSIFSSKFDPTDTCTWITNCRCPRCRLQQFVPPMLHCFGLVGAPLLPLFWSPRWDGPRGACHLFILSYHWFYVQYSILCLLNFTIMYLKNLIMYFYPVMKSNK